MKKILSTILRDRNTPIERFRQASDELAMLLALEIATVLPKEEYTVETPLAKTTGYRFKNGVVLVPILRAGLALLFPFLKVLPHARVGMMGLKRDEKTAKPHQYYENIPPFTAEDEIIVLDPMLATGGSVSRTLEILIAKGAKPSQLQLVSIISAPEGEAVLKKSFPACRVTAAVQDEKLNSHFFIHPGLGDYGDRYFGTVS